MRTLTIHCDCCGELTHEPTVLAITAGPAYGRTPPTIDLCPACWAALQAGLTGRLETPDRTPAPLTHP